jgi:K+ transporter
VALGTLSLIVWTLPMTTSLKYVAIVMLPGIQHGERAPR